MPSGAQKKRKKAPSPTGRPSAVDPAVRAFMRGEDPRGKRPVAIKVAPSDRPTPRSPSGIRALQIELATDPDRAKRKKKRKQQ